MKWNLFSWVYYERVVFSSFVQLFFSFLLFSFSTRSHRFSIYFVASLCVCVCCSEWYAKCVQLLFWMCVRAFIYFVCNCQHHRNQFERHIQNLLTHIRILWRFCIVGAAGCWCHCMRCQNFAHQITCSRIGSQSWKILCDKQFSLPKNKLYPTCSYLKWEREQLSTEWETAHTHTKHNGSILLVHIFDLKMNGFCFIWNSWINAHARQQMHLPAKFNEVESVFRLEKCCIDRIAFYPISFLSVFVSRL